MSNEPKITIEYIKSIMEKVARELGVHPSKVTPTALKGEDERLTPWKLREYGGITGLRKYFPLTSKDLAEIKKQKDVQSYINKLEKDLGEKINFEQRVLNTLERSIRSIKPIKYKVPNRKILKSNEKMTMELMISDVHYGKKTSSFNLEVCRKRIKNLGKKFLSEMEFKKKQGYDVERVIIAMIGDIIESYTMHGSESSLSCEFGNPKQIQSAIDSLFDDLILPIAMTGVDVVVPAVAGNHDRTEVNRTFNNPGENYMTWVIYNSLRRYCELSNLTNVKFDIPTDGFTVLNVYGDNILYEHTDVLKSISKINLYKLMENRSKQLRTRIDMIRGGHWHEYVCFDRGLAIINESVCGQDSYAKIKGYNSKSGQTINFYVDNKSMPNSFLYSYPVYLE